MDLFFGFLKDVFRGFNRAISAFVFHKLLFKMRKPPKAVTSKRVVLIKNNICDNPRLYG